MITFLISLAAAAGVTAPARAEAPYLKPQHLVRLPDGRRLNVYCTGRGGPTVVLEGGWTTETGYWRKVQPLLARRSRVCSYDRAGYGFSDVGPMPRAAAAIESDFAALVERYIAGRIILVAHSLGSFPARLYAGKHPDRVAALILLDPPTEDDRALYAAIPQTDPTPFVDEVAACAAAVIAHPQRTPTSSACLDSPAPAMSPRFNRMRSTMQRTAAYQRTAASELKEMYGVSGDQVRAARTSFGSMPLIVLTAQDGATNPARAAEKNAAIRRIQWTAQDGIATLSNRPVHRLLTGASHFIPMERPADVVASVAEARAMLATEGGSSARSPR